MFGATFNQVTRIGQPYILEHRKTIADADIGSLKSLHTLFDKYLDHMLVKFEQNCMIRTIQNLVLFDPKMVNNFWQSVDVILEDVSLTETIVWCWNIDLKTIIYGISVPKIVVVRQVNQVKRCTKHGRPDQSQRKLTVGLALMLHRIKTYMYTIPC